MIETPTETKPSSSLAPTKAITSKPTTNYQSSTYTTEPDEYWEEFKKHSPNDNYLLGFDEDVDDVHDMELYMEDY